MKTFCLPRLAALAFFLASCNVVTPGMVGSMIGLSSTRIVSPQDDECYYDKKSRGFVEGGLCIFPYGILPEGDVLYVGGSNGVLKLDLKNGTQKFLNQYRTLSMARKDGRVYVLGQDSRRWFYLFRGARVFSFADAEAPEEAGTNRFNTYFSNFEDMLYFDGEWYFHDKSDSIYVIRNGRRENLTARLNGSDCGEGPFEEAEIGWIDDFGFVNGELYVTDPGCGRLRKIDLEKGEVVDVDGEFEDVSELASVENRIYYVVDRTSIRYFDLETKERGLYAGGGESAERSRIYAGEHKDEVRFNVVYCLGAYGKTLYVCDFSTSSSKIGYSTVVRIDTETSKVETLLFPKDVSERTE